MKLTKLPKATAQHVLIYGPPKTGKTQLVSELAKQFKIFYIGLEKGHDVFYKLPAEAQENVEILDLPDSRDYPIAIETCLKLFKKQLDGSKPHDVCNAHGKIGCMVCSAAKVKDPEGDYFTSVDLYSLGPDCIVVVDSLSQLTNSAIAHITKGKPDDYKMEFDDWGNLGKLMEIFLSRVQVAPFHVICISHETEAELEDGKMKIVPTAGSRNFSRNSAKYFGHVVYSQVSNAKHEFKSMTTSTVNIVVGSRTDVDTRQGSSLLPIFTGEIQVKPATGSNLSGVSNGHKAANDLAEMAAKLKGLKS